MIALGSDHGGYELKLEVIKHLKDRGFEVTDYGCDSTASCDYPIYGKAVAEAIAAGKQDLGILICGTGIGMSMVANKVEGVRAALCSDCFSAQATREHNNANVLCMGGFIIGNEMGREIPSEREMAAIYKINRNTVKNAINALVEEGVLYKVKNTGVYVTKPDNQRMYYLKNSSNEISRYNVQKRL